MSRLPIIDALQQYKEKEIDYYATPGHKMGRAFTTTKEGRKIISNMVEYDITEVEGMDNLHNPNGIIRESQELLAEYYGSQRSYYLVNGSTSGNLIMIFSVFNEYDKIIVERNCHKSISNAIMLRKLKPIYINNKMSYEYNAPFSVDKEHLFNLIKQNTDAKGIVLTYPNYYGICADLEDIVKEAPKYGMKLLIDSAHGAHFGICDELPCSAVNLGCDIVVNSAHKTLPSLTQTAYLHINNEELIEKVEFYMKIFSTTSPSYLFLSTMEYSRYYLETYGKNDYQKLINICENFRKKIDELKFYHIINEDDVIEVTQKILIDKTRYVINVPSGYSGTKLAEYLRLNNIQVEMADNRNVILIFSPVNDEADFLTLYEVLKKWPQSQLKGNSSINIDYIMPKIKYLPWQTEYMKTNICNIDEGINKVCGQSVIPYPPGVPIIMPGEVINADIINIIKMCVKNGIELIGLKEDKLVVLEEDL